MEEDKELWRWVVGYEGFYMVSDHGNVMSAPINGIRGGHKYTRPGKVRKAFDNGRGYLFVGLYKDGAYKQELVHRMVASAFIPNPEGKPCVNHIDGNKTNNMVDNLEWVTKKENARHASEVLHALDFNRRLTEEQVLAIRSDDRSHREIAEDYGLNQTSITGIINGRTYKNVGGERRHPGRARQRKLDADAIVDIRTSDMTGVALAEKYGVATSTISKIRSGQRYKEV